MYDNTRARRNRGRAPCLKSQSEIRRCSESYLDNIQAKTGKTPDDFRALAAEKGLVKNGEIVNWLKTDFGLGHGHANAIAHLIMSTDETKTGPDDPIAAHFAGKKAVWREPYDRAGRPNPGIRQRCRDRARQVVYQPGARRPQVRHRPNLRRRTGWTSASSARGSHATERFEAAGSWNAMVTHRVRITDPAQIDAEVLAWLKLAYDAA